MYVFQKKCETFLAVATSKISKSYVLFSCHKLEENVIISPKKQTETELIEFGQFMQRQKMRPKHVRLPSPLRSCHIKIYRNKHFVSSRSRPMTRT